MNIPARVGPNPRTRVMHRGCRPMQFALVYEIGDAPEQTEEEEFPSAEAAKDFARQSLRMMLAMSSAQQGSVSVGQIEGPGEGDIAWLGAYGLKRQGQPVWSQRTRLTDH